HRGGGGGKGEQHRVRALCRRVDGQRVAHPEDVRGAQSGRGLGEYFQQVRPCLALRRVQGKRLRPGRWTAGPARLRPTRLTLTPMSARLPITKTPKVYVGGAFIR